MSDSGHFVSTFRQFWSFGVWLLLFCVSSRSFRCLIVVWFPFRSFCVHFSSFGVILSLFFVIWCLILVILCILLAFWCLSSELFKFQKGNMNTHFQERLYLRGSLSPWDCTWWANSVIHPWSHLQTTDGELLLLYLVTSVMWIWADAWLLVPELISKLFLPQLY